MINIIEMKKNQNLDKNCHHLEMLISSLFYLTKTCLILE